MDMHSPPERHLCTDCGISRTDDPKRCGRACQFIKPDYPALETQVHGRTRDESRPDELFFGPFQRMVRARLAAPRVGAQWTGITTRIGERLLETGAVDAVLAVGPHPEDAWRPVPVLVTKAEDMAKVRGMRMGYAPLLSLLEPARAAGHRADYHVELRFTDGRKQEIPFLQLPISQLPRDFFPLTCQTCVDYTNVLADITVGYMAGQGEQWLLVRNARGEELAGLLGDELKTAPLGSAGKRQGPVKGFLANTRLAAGGLPLRRMPNFMRHVVGWLMPRVGPRGLEFARARVEMKAVETVLHLRRAERPRMKSMIPGHVWKLVAPYGLTPEEGETSKK
jgi:coenzyme F420 hydrogenase subunit beta